MHNTPRMVPEWLGTLLSTNKSAPKLYAWRPSDIEDPTASVDQAKFTSSELVRQADDSRIYILGVGNLGVLFAASLASLPKPPDITLVLHRKELLLSWQQEPGLEITRGGVLHKHSGFNVELWSEEPPPGRQPREVANGQNIRNLVVTTKAAQALPEVDRVRRYLNGDSTVAFVQNGMCKMWPPHGTTYNSERYSQDQSHHPNWLACVTTHGVTSAGRFRSVHASEADVKVGPVLSSTKSPESATYLSDALVRAPHLNGTSVARHDLWILQLEKLVVNSIINPLTAILRCKNGKLFAEEGNIIAQLMDRLLYEAGGVLRALVADSIATSILQATSNGDHVSRDKTVPPEDLLNRFSHARLKEMLYEVGHKVRENTSSMLQDVRAGKQTEIDEFNGWLVETAAYLGGNLDVTSHKILIDLVKKGAILDTDSLSSHFPH
ncbi:putative 2-dehydropantoate 2-reductase [Colletotrichum kahawae]|uniref:2-dehydropantoate 2-reductase n=1 Tax=Colletotrichum kahawae TaxID=34407 RepID=A0AAD9Y0Q3_COLKA|nr:putative 2-dehydropantoate 2-reductase [Colletotrichum kahawae]